MIDHADTDLLVGFVFAEQRQILAVAAGAFKRDHISIELQQVWHRAIIAWHFPIDTLLVWIAPAGVDPDLGLNSDKLSIEGFSEEFEVGVGAVGAQRTPVMRWLLD